MVNVDEYLRLRERPQGRPAMRQSWRDLLFLHVSADPADIAALLPAGLQIDTFPDASGRERAWVGLVPFRMYGIRPVYAPALPWLSAFPETNVRTYVHVKGHLPGVWFFSLDAARWIATRIARSRFQLPYFHATMTCRRSADEIHYRSRRREGTPADLSIDARVGEDLPLPQPGSFEFYLVERYLLYSEKDGQLFTGQVHHKPYELKSVDLLDCQQNLIEASGMNCGPWDHMCFSEGVDVEVFPLEPLRSKS